MTRVRRSTTEPVNVTLAQRLASAREAVVDLERRVNACPHDWAEKVRRPQTYYVKGIRPDGRSYPPIHVTVITSTCTRCGTTRTIEEEIDD